METLDASNPKHSRADDKLRHEIAAWLTTVTADGQPQSTPIWFHWDGSTFLFYSQPGRPKLVNIAVNPKVSLHPVGDHDAEDAVTIEGIATIDRSAPPGDQIPAYISKYLELIDGFGWTPASFAADFSVPVRMTLTRIRIL